MSEKQLRIGLVCPYSFDEPGGVQAHILDLAEYLRAQGHWARVIGPATRTEGLPDYVVAGGAAISVPYNGSVARLSVGPQVSRRLRRFIDQGSFDILHIHEPNAPSYSMQALRIATGPIVATYHASAADSLLLKVVTPGLRPMLEKISGGIAVSELARRWQVEQLGGDPVLIPNGIAIGGFQAADQPRSKNPAELRIGFVGRIDEPRKGLDVLLSAFARLHEENPATQLVVMGAGDARPRPGVRFLGRVTEAEKQLWLGQTDIYVAPNTGGESFGIVLVEAMAAGCAVIASDLEAFQDVLGTRTASPHGLTFRNGDANDLYRVLSALATDGVARNDLQERGRVACRRYDWNVVGQEIVRVYEAVADGTIVWTGVRG